MCNLDFKILFFVVVQPSTYCFGHEPYGLITVILLTFYAYNIMLVPCYLNIISQVLPVVHLARYPNSLYMIFGLATLCISVKVSNAFTCRPLEMLLNIRFISILITQLIGYVGSLLFVYKLGSIFAIEIPTKMSPNKSSFTPFSRSFVIDLK